MTWNEEVAQRDYMPVEERRALQLKRLQATVQRVYERVPFYRKALNERGIEPAAIRSLDDLSRLPFTTRHDLLGNYPLGLLAVPREQVIRIHGSSGTKGKPKIVAYTRNDIDIWGEVVARGLICAGARPGDVVQNAYIMVLSTWAPRGSQFPAAIPSARSCCCVTCKQPPSPVRLRMP